MSARVVHLTFTDVPFAVFSDTRISRRSCYTTQASTGQYTDKLRLTTLGTIFDNVSLSKVVPFKVLNGLPGVTISNFKLPGDDPAGGITISTDSMIPSPA